MFLLKKCHIRKPHRLLLLKMKSDSESRSGVSQIFNFGAGSGRKTQDPAGVDSGCVAAFGVGPSDTLKTGLLVSSFP